ncbi:MAG: DUF2817 domain-containing protein [Pseudomonadota bacterium]
MKILKISNWAMSPKNNSIDLYHNSKFHPQKECNPVIFIGGTHGDEPEGVRLAEELLSWLEKAPETEHPWALIPCLNPDGYQQGKRTNGNGVDLNRNYPSKNWSPEAKQERYFPGPQAGSEPEIKALTSLTDQVSPRLFVHFHSWQPMIVVSGPVDLPEATALAEASGYELKPDIGYPTSGSLSEYGWKDRDVPVICIEEQEKIDLETVWPRFRSGFEKIFAMMGTC